MRNHGVAAVLVALVLAAAPVRAQEPDTGVGDFYGELNNPERNSAGTPINQDYFAREQFSGTKYLIYLVEKGHVNEKVFNDFQTGDYKSVLADMKYALERVPNHPRALMLLCGVARMTSQPAIPIPFFERALKLYPQYAFTHAQFGLYLTQIEQYDAGIEQLKKATEIDPKMAQAQAWLAEAYFDKGDRESGRLAAEQARKLGHQKPIPGEDAASSARN